MYTPAIGFTYWLASKRGGGWKRPFLSVHQLPQGNSGTGRGLSGEPKGNGQEIFGKRLGLPLCRKQSGRSPESRQKLRSGAGVTLVEFQPLSHPDSFRYVIM